VARRVNEGDEGKGIWLRGLHIYVQNRMIKLAIGLSGAGRRGRGGKMVW
jgi:hypothetical protein